MMATISDLALQALVRRVTPCAPLHEHRRRRAEDCPPYQFPKVSLEK